MTPKSSCNVDKFASDKDLESSLVTVKFILLLVDESNTGDDSDVNLDNIGDIGREKLLAFNKDLTDGE